MQFKTILVFLFLILSYLSYCQVIKADHFYQLGDYPSAIKYYEKAIKKDTSLALLRRLGECYYKTREYGLAEIAYRQLSSKNPDNADDAYQYTLILLSSGKYDQAIAQFEKLKETKKYSSKASEQLKFCRNVKNARKSDTSFIVTNSNNLNSPKNEFSPFVIDNELYYTGESISNDLYDIEQNQTAYSLLKRKMIHINTPNVVFSDKSAPVKTINTSGANGSACYSDSDKVLYYTSVSLARVSKDSGKINRPAIFLSTKNKDKWSDPKSFQWNDPDYSFEHPAVSRDGKTIVFSSDMPGGYGKSDLYVCEKQNNQWSKPKNLGPAINTTENEVFPYLSFRKDLYFSSDGHVGFGGLDVFSSKLAGSQWLFVKNLGFNANSNKDDFGVCFIYKDSLGLFSSNRDGGLGGDDIYTLISMKQETKISANIFLTENIKNPAKNRKLFLLTLNGEKIDSTVTDQYGYFDFNIFDTEKSFMVEVDEDDAKLKAKARYFMIDKNNNTVRISHKLNAKQKYVFKSLPIDPNGLPDLFEEEGLNLGGNISIGETPLSNRKVMLINEFGDIVEQSNTNELGSFAFRNLPTGQNYSLYVNDEKLPVNAKIMVTNKQGKEIKTTRIDENNNLNFDILSIDNNSLKDLAIGDDQLLMQLNGFLFDQDRRALMNANVIIIDNDVAIENILTDVNGHFQTKKLNTSKTYSFMLEDPDEKFKYVKKLYLADSKGRIYKEIKRKNDGKFQFDLLNIDKYMMGDNTFDDPWLQALDMKNKVKSDEVIIYENLNYPSGEWKVDNVVSKILDKVGFVLQSNINLSVEISSHTDAQGSDQFNMQLSEKRAKAVFNYLLLKGVKPTRLSAKGYGETRLLNHCKNGVTCEDVEHAVNRRTEFRFYKIK